MENSFELIKKVLKGLSEKIILNNKKCKISFNYDYRTDNLILTIPMAGGFQSITVNLNENPETFVDDIINLLKNHNEEYNKLIS